MNATLVELVRLLAITAQLQIVTAQDRTNSVSLQRPPGPTEREAVIPLCTERQGTLAQLQIRLPRPPDDTGGKDLSNWKTQEFETILNGAPPSLVRLPTLWRNYKRQCG